MMADLKEKVLDWTDEEAVGDYLKKLLHKEAFDRAGLIYGIGHAVYSVSDPRAEVFRGFVEKLAHEKHLDKEFALYSTVERLAPEIIASERKIYKGVSANVDFYSGFVYNMLGLPVELFTPIFAVARIAVGARIGLRSLSVEERSFVPLIWRYTREEAMYRLTEDKKILLYIDVPLMKLSPKL